MAKRAPGKYDAVLHKLSKIGSTEEPAHQEKVERIKIEMRQAFNESEQPEVAAAKRYRELRFAQAEAKAALSAVNVELDAVTQLLVESQEMGASAWGQYGASPLSMRLVTGDALRVAPEPYTVVEDRDAIRDYFISSGLIRLLTPPWQTINSHNKERLLNGEPELPGTKLYIKTGIVFTPNKEDKIDPVTRAAADAAESDL